MSENVIATRPTVTKVVVTLEPDDITPRDWNGPSTFHWERFGRYVEIDDSDYRSPFSDHHEFDWDDEDHPIYTQPRGARLVIDKSDQYTNADVAKYGTDEVLRWLRQDAKLMRQWLQGYWRYVVVHVTATVATNVNGTTFYDEDEDYIGGVSDGLGGLDTSYTAADEQEYQREIAADIIGDMKSRLSARGVVWPDDLEVEFE